MITKSLAESFTDDWQSGVYRMAVNAVEQRVGAKSPWQRSLAANDPFAIAADGIDLLRNFTNSLYGGAVASTAQRLGMPNGDALLAAKIVVGLGPLPFNALLKGTAVSLRAVGLLVDFEFQALGIAPTVVHPRAEESLQIVANALGFTISAARTPAMLREPHRVAVEEPAAKHVVVQEPAVQPADVEQSTIERAHVEEPAVKPATVEEPDVEQVVVEDPAVEQVPVEEPAVERVVVEEPAVEPIVVEEPTVERVVEVEPPRREPPRPWVPPGPSPGGWGF